MRNIGKMMLLPCKIDENGENLYTICVFCVDAGFARRIVTNDAKTYFARFCIILGYVMKSLSTNTYEFLYLTSEDLFGNTDDAFQYNKGNAIFFESAIEPMDPLSYEKCCKFVDRYAYIYIVIFVFVCFVLLVCFVVNKSFFSNRTQWS